MLPFSEYMMKTTIQIEAERDTSSEKTLLVFLLVEFIKPNTHCVFQKTYEKFLQLPYEIETCE